MLAQIQHNSFLKIYKRIFYGYLISRYKPFITTLIAMIIVALCDPAFASLMKPIIDKSFNANSLSHISFTPLLIAIIFGIKGIAAFINEKNTTSLSASIVQEMRNQLFQKILRLPLSYHNEIQSGRIISKIIFDITQITDAGFNLITVTVRDGFTVLGLISLLIYTDWQLTLFCLFTMPLVLIIIRKLSKKIRMLSLDNQAQYGNMTQILKEATTGQKLIKLSVSYQEELNKLAKLTSSIKNNAIDQAATSSLNSSLSQFLISLALSCILFFATTRAHSNGFSAGGLVSFVSAMLLIFQPMKRITAATQSVQKGIAAAISVFELLDSPSEPNLGKDTQINFTQSIEITNLSFGYNNINILNNISISIPKGHTIALVGESGSGKTSIINLLARFYSPPPQSIFIDEKDINNFDIDSWRKKICIVSQDVFLFNDTIFNNITYGSLGQQYSFEQVKYATVIANACDFIEELPQKFNTIIGENGAKLSGGQKQRIAIARAALQNPEILILDEATSALDSATEQIVINALTSLMKNRTTIIIAHKLYLTKKADYIYVLNNSKIIEKGNHQDLIALKQNYYKLYSIGGNIE